MFCLYSAGSAGSASDVVTTIDAETAELAENKHVFALLCGFSGFCV